MQEGKLALQSCTGTFLSIDTEDDTLVAIGKVAGEDHMINIRSQTIKEDTSQKEKTSEEQGSLSQVEVNYV